MVSVLWHLYSRHTQAPGSHRSTTDAVYVLAPVWPDCVSAHRALWLGTSVAGFNARWLTNDFKKQVKDAAEPTTGHTIGPLDVLFKLYNQDVSLTDRRLSSWLIELYSLPRYGHGLGEGERGGGVFASRCTTERYETW